MKSKDPKNPDLWARGRILPLRSPFATTVWDYINRGMPLNREGTLTPDEVYSLTAFLLFINDVIPEDQALDQQSLPKVKMPIGGNYAPLPDWKPRTKRLQGYPYQLSENSLSSNESLSATCNQPPHLLSWDMMRKRLSATTVEFLNVWGVLTALVVVGFVATYQYVGAPPPKAIRIATGTEDGAYYAFAQRYARLLAGDGIELEVVPTAGSVANLELLRRGDVTLALVQGGTATAADREQLQALGTLFLEPLWIFTGEHATIQRLPELEGARLAVGAIGSGTNLLATQILSASGITESNATVIHRDASEAGRLLSRRAVDAAFLVASPSAPFVQELLREPAIELFDFERAAAYSRVFPFLTPVVLSEGVLNLERNVPGRDTTVVAVAATLAARADLNPSLIPALLDTVTRVHRPGGVLEQPRKFPSVDLADLPLNDDAARYITEGPSFLYRWLPYGTAVRLDRLKLLVLPLFALLIPLFRVAPPLYQWRIRSKIYRWYAAVRDIDLMVREETIDGRADVAANRLRALEREVASVSVPLAYTGELYHLRLHLQLLEEKLEALARPRRGEPQKSH